MKKAKITLADIEIYEYIVAYKKMNGGNSPSRREIMDNTNSASSSTVNFSLKKLEKAGYIELKYGEQYIRIIGDNWVVPPPYFGRPFQGELVKEE